MSIVSFITYLNTLLFHSELSCWFYGFLFLAFIGYIVATGLTYYYLYIYKKNKFGGEKTQKELPSRGQIKREIKDSLSSAFVWVLVAVGVLAGVDQGVFLIYDGPFYENLYYFMGSIFLLVILHDTYFYWTHRAMHSSKKVYDTFHKTHHLSTNPTPFAIHAFSPLEALLYSLYVPLVLLFIPIHLYALLIWFLIEASFNIMGHSGYELFPRHIFATKIGSWFNSPFHHNLHHQEPRTGFGHYFNFWDTIMNTNNKGYEKSLSDNK